MKKLLITILITLLMANSAVIVSFGAEESPTILAESAVLIDASTGQVLYDKNMNAQHYPASTTKVMTALLTLENLDLTKTVTIDAETPFTGGSRVYLLEGEQVTVKQLMYALLLESANDAAVALGKEIAGSIPEFADMMNKRAKELGAKNTHFVNPNGLPDEAHVTTAYDLAMIAKEAMKNQTFRKFVKTYRYIIPKTNMQDTRYLYNTNRLLYDKKTKVLVNGVERRAKYDGAIGIKTGYTGEAGGCLIAGAKRGDTELISVVMKSTNEGRFSDSIALLDYGFANYKSTKAMDKGTILGEVKVNRGATRKVEVVAKEAAYATLPIDASEKLVKTKIVLDKKVKAPVAAGQKVGEVQIYEGNSLVGHVDAVTTKAIPKGGVLSIIGISDGVAHVIEIIFSAAIGLILFLFTAFVILKRRRARRRRKRREERLLRMQGPNRDNEYWRY